MSPDNQLILYRRAGLGLPKRDLLQFATRLRDEVAEQSSFSCLLTDDRELRRLNLQFLKHDYATDVLSFPSGERAHLGDIAISVDRAKEQANQYGHAIPDELKILMLHGVLHLLGMDHEKDKGSMARKEKMWRKKLGLPSGLIERVRT